MLSEQKENFLYQYDNKIIWNISAFGNVGHMHTLDVFLDQLKKYNQKNPIYTVHGSYSCKYNGGRQALFYESKTNIENQIKKYNKQDIGVKLTFSNMNIHKEQFEEEEMRWYLDLLNETKGIGNGIICVNDDFAELVKKNYPDLDLVASHVKMELETKMGITDTIDYYNSKFDLYDIVVMNTYRAFDDDFLSKIKHPEKVEFIVNHSCTTNCPFAKQHHEMIDQLQQIVINYNYDKKELYRARDYIDLKKEIKSLLNKCKEIKFESNIEKIRKQFINREEINYLSNTFGINKFKIEGRDLSLFEFIMSLDRFIINNNSMYDILYSKKQLELPNLSKTVENFEYCD